MGQRLKQGPWLHTELESLFRYMPECSAVMPPSQTVLQQRWLCLVQVCPAWFQRMQFALPSEKYPPISLVPPPLCAL